MTTLSIRVPDSLHRAIKELAAKDGYSMNQFLITAAAEKLSALEPWTTSGIVPSVRISRISTAFWRWFPMPNRTPAMSCPTRGAEANPVAGFTFNPQSSARSVAGIRACNT